MNLNYCQYEESTAGSVLCYKRILLDITSEKLFSSKFKLKLRNITIFVSNYRWLIYKLLELLTFFLRFMVLVSFLVKNPEENLFRKWSFFKHDWRNLKVHLPLIKLISRNFLSVCKKSSKEKQKFLEFLSKNYFYIHVYINL